MPSPTFEERFVSYVCVASLAIMLWDILDNLKNDYRLLFRLRLGPPTIIYFLSRVSVLGYILVGTIYSTTPSIPCMEFEATFIGFVIVGLASTPFLAYLRVCGVWNWNRFIVGLFGASWLCAAASNLTLTHFTQWVREEGYCGDIIAGRGWQLLAPIITNFVNHTAIFLAITYGVCKNTINGDLTFRDRTRLIFGQSLPTFSKALLHDSQVSYIIIVVAAATVVAWCYVWKEVQPTSAFRLALVPLFIVLENIMICRVFRNTKLDPYNKTLVCNNPRSETHISPHGMNACNSGNGHTDAHSTSIMPIQIVVNQNVEYKTDPH